MIYSLTQCSTLIVDDFQEMHTLLRGFVKAMGVKVIDDAFNAKEALSMLGSKKYDIVICDYNLGPGKNGQQILEEARLRKYIGYSTIWIMVTAEKTMDMFMCAAEIKPDDYLLKPINEHILKSRLNKLIERKQTFSNIENAMKANDYITAISLCDEQLKDSSSSAPDILRLKSDLLITTGNLTAAKALFEEVLSTRNAPWARLGLGKIHFASNEFARAKEIFQQALKENRMYLEAADWLAKTLEVTGDTKQAQQVLFDATEISPNASSRQKKLADTAHKNGALDLAQTAYEKVIKLNEFSVVKNTNAHMGLAKVLTDKDSPQEAMKILNQCIGEFEGAPEAAMNAAVVQSMIHQKMGQPEEAKLALKEAERLMDTLSGNAEADVKMDMAKVLLQLGEKDKAYGLLESVVKNNHENMGVINQVEAVFESEGLGSEGKGLIKKFTEEIIEINDKGVLLAREEKFEEGIKLLREALQQLPNNVLFITNLCGMLIGLMMKKGKDDRLIGEIGKHLEHVREIDPNNKKYYVYINALSRL